MPDKKDIIRLLDEIGDMMEFNGENPFKVGAYRNGANAIRKTEFDLNSLISSRQLDQIKGIGKGLQSVIYEYCEKGFSSLYEDLKKDVPAGIGDLLKIKGLGPKKIKLLYTELGISTIDQLYDVAKEGKLLSVKGFTQSASDKIIEEVERVKLSSNYILLHHALNHCDEIITRFIKLSCVEKMVSSGQLRRTMEVFSLLEFEILTSDKEELLKEIGNVYSFDLSDDKVIIKDVYEVPVIFYITEDENKFSYNHLVHTGSKEFLQGYLNEIPFANTEEEICESAGKKYIIPEMREEEFLNVTKEELKKNSDLVVGSFKGLLHFHTTYSDGRDTMEDMISEAEKLHFEYIAVCEHSKSAYYAQGLTEEKILQQTEALKKLKKKYNVKLLQGIESDILQDGSLDYQEDFFSNFDFVVSSIHSRFNMDEKEMTKRIIKAVENPNTDVLAHPSGRLLLSREPYKYDVHKVIDACFQNQVAIEINANPHRLDIDWRYVYYAREKGCMFTINADAHSIEEIQLLNYGIMMGRKAGLQSSEVINCYDFSKFKEFLKRKIKRDLII